MRRTATLWVLLAMFMVVTTGIMGDIIFAPSAPDWFSFRVLSGYIVAVMAAVVAIVSLNCK